MRYVVVGDIHGNFDALQDALKKASFNPITDTLISLGDNFDRGRQSVEVWNFLKSLPNKVLIRGNHEVYLYRALQSSTVSSMDVYNGTAGTIAQLCGKPFTANLFFDIPSLRYAASLGILEWIKYDMHWCFETEHYIFTHGWLPENHGRYPKDLQHVHRSRWLGCCQGNNIAHIRRHMETYPNGYKKTIVFGHWSTDLLRRDIDGLKEYDNYQIWTGDKWIDKQHKLIGLDSTSVLTNKIDYIIIEDKPQEEL